MTRIVLVRHGEADVTGRVLTGRAGDVHLNARGQAQAERVARWLDGVEIAAIWSSPLERARETAAPLAQRRSLEVTVAESLQELDFGDWQGRALETLEPDPAWTDYNRFRSLHRAPGGESIAEAQVRMARALETMVREFPGHAPGDCVVAVGHGDPIRALLAHVLGVPLDLFGRLSVEPGSISAIEVGPGGPRVLCLNEADGFGRLRSG